MTSYLWYGISKTPNHNEGMVFTNTIPGVLKMLVNEVKNIKTIYCEKKTHILDMLKTLRLKEA